MLSASRIVRCACPTNNIANPPVSNALKLRKHLLKQLEKIKAASTAGLDISQLEAADGILEK